MTQLYPDDFDELGIEAFSCKLDTFIFYVHDDGRFSFPDLRGIGELSRKLLQTKKHLSFPGLYLLVKLALLLPVSASTVQRVFSTMKIIMTNLHDGISDEFLSDTVVTYLEDDLFEEYQRRYHISFRRHKGSLRTLFYSVWGVVGCSFQNPSNLSIDVTCLAFVTFFLESDYELMPFSERKLDYNRYYIGYPKDLGPSRVIHFTSERHFVQILHQGYPMVVAFTIKSNYTKHLDKVLEEAAAEFYPHVKFMRVECPKYPGFCIARQRKEYPFVEIFHSPEQQASRGRVVDPNVTKYSVKVLPFNYDLSAYGFREFFRRHGIQMSVPSEPQ